jgi:sulfur relay protein TusB/DsrH
MSTLHTINKSQDHTHLFDKLKLAISAGDAVLLIEDGCYAITDRDLIEQLSAKCGSTVLALSDDVRARGLAAPSQDQPEFNQTGTHSNELQYISYNEFVQQCLTHDKTISWF